MLLRLLLRDRGLAEPTPKAAPMKADGHDSHDDHGSQGSHGGHGSQSLSNLSQELQVLEAELQPLLAKAQELVDSITVEAREVAMDVQFHDISQRFQARISDAQRLQDRCSSLLQAPHAPQAPAPIGSDVHHRAQSPTAGKANNASNASNAKNTPSAPTGKSAKANRPGTSETA